MLLCIIRAINAAIPLKNQKIMVWLALAAKLNKPTFKYLVLLNQLKISKLLSYFFY